MHAFRSYIFAARIACYSGPTCQFIYDDLEVIESHPPKKSAVFGLHEN